MGKGFAEQFKECGRNGTLFVLALFLVLWGGVSSRTLPNQVIVGLWLLWLLLAIRWLYRFVQAWRHPVRLGPLPPLSQNDLRVARSKLTKCDTQRLR